LPVAPVSKQKIGRKRRREPTTRYAKPKRARCQVRKPISNAEIISTSNTLICERLNVTNRSAERRF
jgi:hypothetical protein